MVQLDVETLVRLRLLVVVLVAAWVEVLVEVLVVVLVAAWVEVLVVVLVVVLVAAWVELRLAAPGGMVDYYLYWQILLESLKFEASNY